MRVRITKRSITGNNTYREYSKWYSTRIGEVFEVRELGEDYNNWYRLDKEGLPAMELYIHKEDVEVVMKRPELKSGMIVEYKVGSTELTRALVVGNTVIVFHKGYSAENTTYADIPYLEKQKITRIFEGASGERYSICVLPDYIWKDSYQKEIWCAEDNTVVLNKKYTAEVLPNGKVKVGCQEFELDVIREIISVANRLNTAK